jgi:predicted nucleotidyltransferase
MSTLDHASRRAIRSAVQGVVPDLIAVYQFGSTVQGGTHEDSDLDLAILPPRPLDNRDRWDLQETLAVELRRDVDLVDLRAATTVMQVQVVSRGSVLAEWDRTAREQFEMQVYSAYALLNEERAGILDDVRARGRIYGR